MKRLLSQIYKFFINKLYNLWEYIGENSKSISTPGGFYYPHYLINKWIGNNIKHYNVTFLDRYEYMKELSDYFGQIQPFKRFNQQRRNNK